MQRFSALLWIGLRLLSRLASAQQCPAVPADSISNGGIGADSGGALPWTVPQVRGTLREVLRRLKYEFVEPVSDTAALETKPSYRFPDDPLARTFQRYKHPGVVVRAIVRPEGDSSRLFVFVRSICHVAEAPPPGYTVPVETTLELFAENEIESELFNRLHREHPRQYPSCANNPSPDTTVFDVHQLSQPPLVVSAPEVHYPDTLRRMGQSGRVVYSLIVNADGRPDRQSFRIVRGDAIQFEQAAREYLEGIRYSPACLSGHAVRVRIDVPIDFKIRR